ncbi:MAG: putative tellurite resistance protein B-like protein [Rhodoferax sp.]|jgi:uncharacterized tellurite resistance protein B-like protein
MLRTLKDFFNTITATPQSPEELEHTLQLATAVLLVEVMRADPKIDVSARSTVLTALRQKFSLADDELTHLMALAEQTATHAYDYQGFTSSLNDHFTQSQKIRIVEAMWQVAYADAHLDANENHLISKIAGLLHVTHGEYIGAKLRAKEIAPEHP